MAEGLAGLGACQRGAQRGRNWKWSGFSSLPDTTIGSTSTFGCALGPSCDFYLTSSGLGLEEWSLGPLGAESDVG